MNRYSRPKYLLRAMQLASLLAAVLAASCTQDHGYTPTTIVIPVRLNVAVVNLAGVYDAVSRYATDNGLVPDPAQSSKEKGTFVSRRVRCAPNGDERQSDWCVFSFGVSPAPDNPLQTSVSVRLQVPDRAEYDPKSVAQQIRIEPTLDGLVRALRSRFGTAAVAQTDFLTF